MRRIVVLSALVLFAATVSAATLEELDGPLVLLGRVPAREGAEVPALAGLGVLLARIEAVLARFKLADHGVLPTLRRFPR